MKDPHFGFDGVPACYASAWAALLSQCPAGVDLYVWEAAIYASADLFGWGGAPNLIGFARLTISRRDPEWFHCEKSEISAALRAIARR